MCWVSLGLLPPAQARPNVSFQQCGTTGQDEGTPGRVPPAGGPWSTGDLLYRDRHRGRYTGRLAQVARLLEVLRPGPSLRFAELAEPSFDRLCLGRAICKRIVLGGFKPRVLCSFIGQARIILIQRI